MTTAATKKTKLYVIDNGMEPDDHSIYYILAPRNLPNEIAFEICRARSPYANNAYIVLVTSKYVWLAGTDRGDGPQTLAEHFGKVGPHNAVEFEKLSKKAKRYLNSAWSEAADLEAARVQAAAPVPPEDRVDPIVETDGAVFEGKEALIDVMAREQREAEQCPNKGAVDLLDFTPCPHCERLATAFAKKNEKAAAKVQAKEQGIIEDF